MKLAFACPYYGPTPNLVGDSQRANLMNAAAAGHEWVDDYSTSGMQHRNACEQIAQRAAKDDRVEAVFWTEHDVILPPEAVQRLVYTLEATPEADVVSGIVFRRCRPYNPMISFRDTGFTRERYELCLAHKDPNIRRVAKALTFDEMSAKMLKALDHLNTSDPPFECYTASMGCLLFRQNMFPKVVDIPNLFAVDSLGLFSIDNIFFMHCQEKGIKLYCDPAVHCGHLGDPEIVDWQTWTKQVTQTFEEFDQQKQERLRQAGNQDRIYGELTRLANKHGTDKGTRPHDPASGWLAYTHNYCDFYESQLAPMRLTARKVMELGVWRGASLKMWRDYFPNAVIHGVDSDLTSCLAGLGERIFLHEADQANRHALERFGSDFDLIVDDGGHTMEQQQVSLGALFPRVKPGGFYILEDLHTSFLGEAFGVSPDGSNATIKVVEALPRALASGEALMERRPLPTTYLTAEEAAFLEANVESCVIYGKKSLTSVIRRKP